MEKVVWILAFVIIGSIGFILMKKLDVFLEENCMQPKCRLENRNDVIKIACENPIMLSSVSDVIERSSKEFKETSFYFYTGCRMEIQKLLENESVNIILLMDEIETGNSGDYRKKVSSFVPSCLSEPLTGFTIQPIKSEQKVMYVFWNEKHITEKQRKLLADI